MSNVTLQPALIPVGGLEDFQKSQHTFIGSVSPRGNSVVAHASSVCPHVHLITSANQIISQKTPQVASKKRYPADVLLYFASWDHIPESTVEASVILFSVLFQTIAFVANN